MAWTNAQLTDAVAKGLGKLRVRADAAPMQRYMKTEQPFYGVKKPGRVVLMRDVKKRFVPTSRRQYESAVRALWKQPHREERYVALLYARAFDDFVAAESIPLFETLMVQGAWWDLVDELAVQVVGRVWLRDRAAVEPWADRWIASDDMWLRRAAIIGQVKHKGETDEGRLFSFCRARMHEKEFFIRKGIGWALRAYSYDAPDAVIAFLRAHEGELSPLSFREGAKGMVREGRM
ncbi:MAG: DNA alkylation repair protein [Phycisphaeraceae bacterium]|nr:MAG: DNA alkylation repair protein [Phycisphaeraceae bacterium]